MDSATQMKDVTPDNVRKFLLTRYSEHITATQVNLTEFPRDNFLLSGVIESFGIPEMISAIEAEFRIRLDLALLDAENITRIGPLAQYIAQSANGH